MFENILQETIIISLRKGGGQVRARVQPVMHTALCSIPITSVVAQTDNPQYLGGRGRRSRSSRPVGLPNDTSGDPQNVT